MPVKPVCNLPLYHLLVQHLAPCSHRGLQSVFSGFMHSSRVLFSIHLPTMMNQTCFPPLEGLTVQGKQTLNRPFQILIEVPKALQVLGTGISPSSQASGQTTPLPSLGSGLLVFLKHARASGPLHLLLPFAWISLSHSSPINSVPSSVAAFLSLPFAGSLTRHGPC